MDTISKIVVILLCTVILWLFVEIVCANIHLSENSNKKALINGKDTCILIWEEIPGLLLHQQTNINVIYKDNYGQFHEKEFPSQMITILK